jgi:hypothetical protein
MLDILLIEEFLSLSTDQEIMEPFWTSTSCAEGVSLHLTYGLPVAKEVF